MAACEHVFADPRHQCEHPAVGDSGRCLWHNHAVGKGDPYVRALFLHADALNRTFVEAHLAGLDLKDLPLEGRDLTGADLRDAVLDNCILVGSVLANANLRRATLRHADLRHADLRGANLTGTTFAGADLREADLSGAVLDGTILLGADLRGANLEGAQVADFQWNRLTRFHGIRGLDGNHTKVDSDTTQMFLAPVAMEDLDTAARMAIDRDPDVLRTRVFSVGRSGVIEAPSDLDLTPSQGLAAPQRQGLRLPWLILPALAGLLLGGTAMWLAAPSRSKPGGSTTDPTDIVALQAQREADQTQIRELQDRAMTLSDQLASARQAAATDGARSETIKRQLLDAQADVARLLDADDRAAVAQLKTGELDVLNRDLATATARQERLAKILADGTERFRAESERLTTELGEARSRVVAFEDTQADNVRLKQRLAALTQEHETLASLYQAANVQLTTAKRDIERYLARINGSQLAGLLTEDGSNVPLVPVVPGHPVSLGGDYLVTLTIDKTPGQANGVDLRLVIQRPVAAANPDATVVLYDERRRPLRRIATSFPHVDQGAPFVTVGASVSCDRMPSFARVVLAPGIEDVATR